MFSRIFAFVSLQIDAEFIEGNQSSMLVLKFVYVQLNLMCGLFVISGSSFFVLVFVVDDLFSCRDI